MIDSHWFHEADTVVISLTAACILYTRSVGVVYFAAGASTCSITVKLIKRAIRQPRPPPHVLVGRRVKASFGMPSTHSATITFFATYIAIASWCLPIHATLPDHARFVPIVTTPLAMTIVMSRIWLGYHTWPQVAVGCAYGCSLAMMWFMLWTKGGVREVGQVLERGVWKLYGWS
ncbi:hypothetical protein AGABI1DRAFT_34460 [Agaricus bisporus var. burnettii JB137-S8]|uniref:Phosphatidic acid phosphatase type 2/haloperoxidase domain-containing protein n=1 Tax=Agaricus bisporus var. burnettii (strain JB137-S8 / ATCC MYA-4627 / FGSC 10392) TaxID=597362 RepID=K5X4E5_AGABU|nr:uncharacterized protein AGABI1DRAFT_34460 [Agaricus bisporus var. burnettii JB137-S8]EKM82696.1 hypothetical protein AGABI1DRAFT_34460 [Agaricus bisporus var. burnettii JB137-S8]